MVRLSSFSNLDQLFSALSNSPLMVTFGILGGRKFSIDGKQTFSLRELLKRIDSLYKIEEKDRAALLTARKILEKIHAIDLESSNNLREKALIVRIATAIKSWISSFIYDWREVFSSIRADVDDELKVILCIDAESIGLYADHYAVGYTLVNRKGIKLESGFMACPFDTAKGLESDIKWCRANILPFVPTTITHQNPQELYEAVYQLWMRLKGTYGDDLRVIADWGFPVETNLFARAICLNEKERRFSGPFPLHEIVTALEIAGIDRKKYPPLPSELPLHNPINDTSYSLRLYLMALNVLKKSNLNAMNIQKK